MLTAFNIGKDMALSIQLNGLLKPVAGPPESAFFQMMNAVGSFLFGPTPDGIQSEDLGILNHFTASAQGNVIRRKPCTHKGQEVHRYQYAGDVGSFSFIRQTAAGDYLAQYIKDAYIMGRGSVKATIIQIKFDPRGGAHSSVTWHYPDSIIVPVEGGDYSGSGAVSQGYEFYCPRSQPGGQTGEVTRLEAELISQLSAIQYKSK